MKLFLSGFLGTIFFIGVLPLAFGATRERVIQETIILDNRVVGRLPVMAAALGPSKSGRRTLVIATGEWQQGSRGVQLPNKRARSGVVGTHSEVWLERQWEGETPFTSTSNTDGKGSLGRDEAQDISVGTKKPRTDYPVLPPPTLDKPGQIQGFDSADLCKGHINILYVFPLNTGSRTAEVPCPMAAGIAHIVGERENQAWDENAVSDTGDYGVFQINCYWQRLRIARLGYTCEDLKRLAANVAVARDLWQEQEWAPWRFSGP